MFLVFDASTLILIYQHHQEELFKTIMEKLHADGILLSPVERELLTIPIHEIQNLLQLTSENFSPSQTFSISLGVGERAVLEFVQTKMKDPNSSYICVIDDLTTRKKALELKLPLIGSIGLTTKGFEACAIKGTHDLLVLWEQWRMSGFRIPNQNSLQDFVKHIKKVS